MTAKKNIKTDFPIFSKAKLETKPLIYFDSGATSQKPQVVIDAVSSWYEMYNANVHRGVYELAELATKKFEDARQTVADFINAERQEIVFTKGTTEGINLVAHSWGRKNLQAGNIVLLTEMEHHANIVPWQELAKEKKLKIKYIPISKKGELDLSNIDKLMSGVSLMSITYVSNVLGIINPIAKIIKLAKEKNIPVLVDAAQAAPHFQINVKRLQLDWLVFSGHKMLGPTGVGVLYVRQERYQEMGVYQTGGDMIKSVNLESSQYNAPPQKYEAGTQNLAGVIGLQAAIEYLEKVGLDTVSRHDQMLTQYALRKMTEIPELRIFAKGVKQRIGSISFTIQGIHPHDLATFLSNQGIAIRAGHHCAMPLHKCLEVPATARVSFYIYNDKKEVDYFVKVLKQIIRQWKISVK